MIRPREVEGDGGGSGEADPEDDSVREFMLKNWEVCYENHDS